MDEMFETVRLPISIEQFWALPRNPAYKYEYFDNQAILSPRPKCYHAALDLAPRDVPESIDAWERMTLRPLRDEDWEHLPETFAWAFQSIPPFSAMEEDAALEAARQCLAKTRGGGDGPLVDGACWVAVPADDRPRGAAIVTIQPSHDEPDDLRADDDAPAPPRPRHPHLTWIFVAPMIARHGVGTALLAAAVRGLIDAGHSRLESTFLLGNESSTLWHWRSGFRLLSYPYSMARFARLRKRPRAETDPAPPAEPHAD